MIMLANSNTLNEENKKRLKKLFFVYVIVIAILLAYLPIYLFLPFLRLPCLFNLITGLNCPGCGISRMLSSFANLNIGEGISYNYFLGYSIPVIVVFFGYYSYNFVTKKKIMFFEVSAIVYVILLIAWGIIRNIIGI